MFGLCQDRGPDSQKTAEEGGRQQQYTDISLPSLGKEDVPGEGKGSNWSYHQSFSLGKQPRVSARDDLKIFERQV